MLINLAKPGDGSGYCDNILICNMIILVRIRKHKFYLTGREKEKIGGAPGQGGCRVGEEASD